MNASVPEGLSQLLEEFAIAVLREKPSDLVLFAAGYFNDLAKSHSRAVGGGSGNSVTSAEVEMNGDGGKYSCLDAWIITVVCGVCVCVCVCACV